MTFRRWRPKMIALYSRRIRSSALNTRLSFYGSTSVVVKDLFRTLYRNWLLRREIWQCSRQRACRRRRRAPELRASSTSGVLEQARILTPQDTSLRERHAWITLCVQFARMTSQYNGQYRGGVSMATNGPLNGSKRTRYTWLAANQIQSRNLNWFSFPRFMRQKRSAMQGSIWMGGLCRAIHVRCNIPSCARKMWFVRGEHAPWGRAIVEQARATQTKDHESNGAFRGHWLAVDHCPQNMHAWEEVEKEYEKYNKHHKPERSFLSVVAVTTDKRRERRWHTMPSEDMRCV